MTLDVVYIALGWIRALHEAKDPILHHRLKARMDAVGLDTTLWCVICRAV